MEVQVYPILDGTHQENTSNVPMMSPSIQGNHAILSDTPWNGGETHQTRGSYETHMYVKKWHRSILHYNPCLGC